jgi:hypothetical protein
MNEESKILKKSTKKLKRSTKAASAAEYTAAKKTPKVIAINSCPIWLNSSIHGCLTGAWFCRCRAPK